MLLVAFLFALLLIVPKYICVQLQRGRTKRESDVRWPDQLDLSSRVTLSDGKTMHVEGFGTFRIPAGQETYDAVLSALYLGYRLIDTAELYENEADVGKAVRDFMKDTDTPRSDIFITTKIFTEHHGKDEAVSAGMTSNQRLGLEYIDLLLMHSPLGDLIVETYDGMLELQSTGVVRSVGVSNFGLAHLKALKDYCRPTPVVNQIEMHPLIYKERKGIAEYCAGNDIVITAYGSVLSGHQDLLDQAESLASKYNKTSAQVFLRWALQRQFQIIPKSTHENYQKENIEVYDFSLSDEEMEQLESFSGSVGDYWDPTQEVVHISDLPQPESCHES